MFTSTASTHNRGGKALCPNIDKALKTKNLCKSVEAMEAKDKRQ